MPSLASLLPGHQFAEHHSGIVEAPIDVVWDALEALRWADLRITRPMMMLRGLGVPVLRDGITQTFTDRAGAILVTRAPAGFVLAMVGKPWSAVPQHQRVESLEEVSAFAEPGWLKYGMEWILHPLADGRTLVETRTLCEATDARARRAFRLYWTIVRAGSGAVRRDIIDALRRRTTSAVSGPTRGA